MLNVPDFFEDPQLQNIREKNEIIPRISSIPSNYVGSKRRMLRSIWNFLEEENVEFEDAFDAFSGSAMVSLLFKHMGKSVVANDLLTSSAITAICLLENTDIPLTSEDIHFLCTNVPEGTRTFVRDNYQDRFFTSKECLFLDRFRRNIETLFGPRFYCGFDLLNKATIASIPNSNFTIYGKNLKALRSTHDPNKLFAQEKWRDTTRKRRDDDNNIMFESAMNEMRDKYKSSFAILAAETHVTQHCFLGGRYYNGQTIAKLEHRLQHQRNNGIDLTEQPVLLADFEPALIDGPTCCVFNADIIELLKAGLIQTDLIYLDPPYGGNSSNYAALYRFLEEYLYEQKLEELPHIQTGAKRYAKAKGYQEQFEELLSLCSCFPYWLLSYNDSSYANLNTIVSTIKNAGRKTVVVKDVQFTYQYRKGKNIVDVDHYKDGFANEGHMYTQRGKEYLILAT